MSAMLFAAYASDSDSDTETAPTMTAAVPVAAAAPAAPAVVAPTAAAPPESEGAAATTTVVMPGLDDDDDDNNSKEDNSSFSKKDKKDKKEKKDKKDKKERIVIPSAFGPTAGTGLSLTTSTMHLASSSSSSASSSRVSNASGATPVSVVTPGAKSPASRLALVPPQLRSGRGNVATEDLEGMGLLSPRRIATLNANAGLNTVSASAGAALVAMTDASVTDTAGVSANVQQVTGQVKRSLDANSSNSSSNDAGDETDVAPTTKATRLA